MNKLRRRPPDSTGFTIVETLIVLAIAGLILMTVFLAIPALERNSRNNQRKQDIQSILAAVSTYELRNSGAFPDTTKLKPFLDSYAKNKLTYYDTANISSQTPTGSPSDVHIGQFNPAPDVNTALNNVYIYNYLKCDIATNPGHADNNGAGYNNIVALYALESGSGTASYHCIQL